MLLVVARTEPARYTYLTHVFGKEIVDVILDRRVEERRQRPERVAVEKRRHDRRQRDIAQDLPTYGWGRGRGQGEWRSRRDGIKAAAAAVGRGGARRVRDSR